MSINGDVITAAIGFWNVTVTHTTTSRSVRPHSSYRQSQTRAGSREKTAVTVTKEEHQKMRR
jgi:hypothetical protein